MVNKTPRSASTRDKEARTKHWQLPSSLDTPTPPDGYKFRWIRESVRGYEDNKNVIGRIRQGYELVRADEYPDFDFPSVSEGKNKGIGFGGRIITGKGAIRDCSGRDQYYSDQTKHQQEAVDNDLLKEQHPSMPINKPERQTKVTFGGSKKSE